VTARRRRIGLIATVLGALTLLTPAAFAGTSVGRPVTARDLVRSTTVASSPTTTLVGAASGDWPWFDQAVGPVQIYRVFDGGFHFATWQATSAHTQHPDATAFDYSIHLLPQRLTDPTDAINAKIRSFLATTPKNLIITDWHEPDYTYRYNRQFTPAQYRAGLLALASMVRAQNAIDGGTRRVSLILMAITYRGNWSTTPSDWWPTDARDGGHIDLVEGDMYELPHKTGTACCPAGYTDGINWKSGAAVITPLYDFALANNAQWAVAELGVLEDIHNPMRKANELASAVNFATSHGADHVSYFDVGGPRANWRLRYASPVGTTSMTSNAVIMWKSLVAAAGG
jgi:hypothetical protein